MAPAKKQRNGSIFKRLKVPPSLAHRLYLVERDEREVRAPTFNPDRSRPYSCGSACLQQMTLERQFAVMDAMGDVFRVSIGYRHHCSCDQQSHLPFSSNMPGAVQSPTHANSPAFNFPSAAGTQSQSPSHAFSSSITSPLSSPAHPSEPSSRAASALSLTGSGNSPVRRENESTATNMQGQSGFNNAQTSSLIQPLCRHIVFVLTRVLKVSRESRYMVQRELQASDLMDIYARAPPNPWNSVSSVMNTIIEEVTKRAAQEHSLMSSANRASASRRELKRSSSQSSLQNKEKEQPKRKEASGPEMVWGLTSAPEDMDAWSDADSEISGCADMTSGPNGDLMDLMDIFGGHAGGGKHASPTTLSECNICFEPFGSERLTYCMAKCGNNFHQVHLRLHDVLSVFVWQLPRSIEQCFTVASCFCRRAFHCGPLASPRTTLSRAHCVARRGGTRSSSPPKAWACPGQVTCPTRATVSDSSRTVTSALSSRSTLTDSQVCHLQ
jgi:hypothetical protein